MGLPEKKVQVFFDGGKRGPDKPAAAAAVVLSPEGDTLHHHARLFPETHTSQDAEYEGLLIGLRASVLMGATDVEVFGDSNLVIQHLWGEWTHDAKFEPYHAEARRLIATLASCSGKHVRRHLNAAADRLVNAILDGSYVPFGEEPPEGVPSQLATSLSFVVTLEVPKSRVADAAAAKRVRTEIASAIGSVFTVGAVTVTRL